MFNLHYVKTEIGILKFYLTHFSPVFHFHTPCKCFLMFSGGIEIVWVNTMFFSEKI